MTSDLQNCTANAACPQVCTASEDIAASNIATFCALLAETVTGIFANSLLVCLLYSETANIDKLIKILLSIESGLKILFTVFNGLKAPIALGGYPKVVTDTANLFFSSGSEISDTNSGVCYIISLMCYFSSSAVATYIALSGLVRLKMVLLKEYHGEVSRFQITAMVILGRLDFVQRFCFLLT